MLNDSSSGYTIAMPVPGAFAQLQSNMAATLNIDWLVGLARDVLAGAGSIPAREELMAALDRWVAASRPASLIYQPYISLAGERGPFVDPNARAGFIGLSLDHGFADLARAVLEGLAFAARDCFEAMGPVPDEIRLSGGAARSRSLRQIFGAVTRSGTRTSAREEAGAAGAAMTAAVCLGVYPSMDACSADWVDPLLGDVEAHDETLVGRLRAAVSLLRRCARGLAAGVAVHGAPARDGVMVPHQGGGRVQPQGRLRDGRRSPWSPAAGRRRQSDEQAGARDVSDKQDIVDLLVIGGGVNGAGIARDAAGRGLAVVLCEKDDLAEGTSSRSGKLVHGGLRYLEYYEFRLVREALIEREVLLESAPHIIWPLRFVLPHSPIDRPAWLVRLGLFLYDHLGGRKRLPGTRTLNLRTAPEGAPIRDEFTRAFEYSDCWVDDARLVVLNAVDAREKGARIHTRTACTALRRDGGTWVATLTEAHSGARTEVRARAVVNAAGPVGQPGDRRGRRHQLQAQRAPGEGQPHHRAEVLGRAERLSRPEHRQAGDLHQSLRGQPGADRHDRHPL